MIKFFHTYTVIFLIIVGLGVAMTGCTSPAPTGSTPTSGSTPAPVATTTGILSMVMTSTASASATSLPSTSGNGQTVRLTLTAENLLFDQNTLTVPAGSTVVMTFINKDVSVPHNFALYTDTTAAKKIFTGEIINGVQTVTYTFTAPSTPGNYFFRCDVHPTIMFGTFVVT